ncbi:serine hydrolase [Kribbella sp. CA-245084]|uniref:serine hydrolase n=1 Tax=Kribbella sp. CA-245084 TaxID=3239940 RepID=UPI003D90CFD5
MDGLRGSVEDELWPLVEGFVGSHDVAGLAVAVVRDGEVVSRGFGVRDVGSGTPVTPETMFHLASVSKPFVATAIVSLASKQELDLDAPITEWVPEFTLADGRAGEVTAQGLLSHTSGLPDVSDYGWHDPQLGDDALSEFARSLSSWRLKDPAFSYSNAGYELLGLVLSRATGTTFEDAVRREVLKPLGMQTSTFLLADVPAELAASPHVGMPLAVPGDAYPYTRRHAPSSTLHSNLVELSRGLMAYFESGATLDLMSEPVVQVGNPPWGEAMALDWAVGSYLGYRTLSHSGLDPGFGARLVLVPDRRTGVVVLANSNTVPASSIAKAALDVALGGGDLGLTELRTTKRSIAGPVAEALATSGPDAARAAYHQLPAEEYDPDDEGFDDAVWGAIELHRTNMVWPLLRLWTDLRPDSPAAWTMTAWAHELDDHPDLATTAAHRALTLDPTNDDAADILSRLQT